MWSQEEHDRYLEGLQLYPHGPWKSIAEHVGTRSVRQVQTHAQKYHEKVARRLRGLRKERKKLMRPEHRIDDETMHLCREVENERLSVASSSASSSRSDASSSVHTPPYNHRYSRHPDFGSSEHVLPPRRRPHSGFQEYEYLRHHQGDERVLANPQHAASSAPHGTLAAVSPRRHADLPSFSDCMDYLIEFFGSKEYSDTIWYRQRQRR